MAGIFDKPGLLFGVWMVCVLTQILAYYEAPLPLWWVVATFIGALSPIIKLVLA